MKRVLGKMASLIPGIIRDDFLRKLISLFFALLVYFTVLYRIGDETVIENIPVNISLPPGLVLLDDAPPKVKAKVRTTKRWLNRIAPTDIVINTRVNESKHTPGEPYAFIIDPAEIKTPVGVKVVSITPSEIMAPLDKTSSRTVSVKARFANSPGFPEGFTSGNIKLNPDKVTLTGPASLLGDGEIGTEPIPVDKTTTESFDYEIPVAVKNKLVRASPAKVLAQVEVVKQDSERIFRIVPIRVLKSEDKNFKAEFISTPHVEVSVAGNKNKLKQLKPDQIKAYIDATPFEKPGVYTVHVNCWLDLSDIKIKDIYPAQVQIKISEK